MQQATKSEEALKWQSLLWHNKKNIFIQPFNSQL